MNIAIVEDEMVFQKQLIDMLGGWGKNHGIILNIQCFTSCRQFLDVFKSKYNVIFMDILLPGENGLATAKKIRAKDCDVPIIFVTSTVDYATDGYDIDALYYILKPIEQADVNKCMNRIASIYTSNEYLIQLANNQIVRIKYSDIIYLESQGHYMIINTSSSQFVCRKKISEIKADLPMVFVQCHRSLIVNINHVVAFSHKEITLSTGQSVVMSNSFKDEVAEKFIECSKGNLNWRH